MRGVLSEGMLMCASTPEKVEVIDPPSTCGKCTIQVNDFRLLPCMANSMRLKKTVCFGLISVPGDLVHCEGYTRSPVAQLNPKKKIWEAVSPDLKTNGDTIVCYKGQTLFVPDKGQLKSKSLAGVPVK